jgi:autoinducer 2-degrading protein
MTKLALIATLEVQPGTRNEVMRSLLAHRERCLRDEQGTLQFEPLAPLNEPDKILLYEVYADSAAFAAHMKGASFAIAREEIGSRLLNMTGVQCTPGTDLPS